MTAGGPEIRIKPWDPTPYGGWWPVNPKRNVTGSTEAQADELVNVIYGLDYLRNRDSVSLLAIERRLERSHLDQLPTEGSRT